MPAHHVALRVLLRLWLGPLIVLLLVNAVVATPVLLQDPLRAIPYLWCAAAALAWFFRVHSAHVTAVCSGMIAAGLTARGAEVLFFGGDVYTMNTRITGASLWAFLGWGTLVLGYSSTIFIGRNENDLYMGGAREWTAPG